MPTFAIKVICIQQCQIDADTLEEAKTKAKGGEITRWNTGEMSYQPFVTTLRPWKSGDKLPDAPKAKPTTSGNFAELAKRTLKNSQVRVKEELATVEPSAVGLVGKVDEQA